MSQTKSEPLAKDDLPSLAHMQSTTELHLRRDRGDRIRIPLEVRFENMLALFDSVVASTIIASAKSHDASDQVLANWLDDDLFKLRTWIENIKAIMPDAEFPRNSLKILGKLDGPVVAILLSVLGRMGTDLSELSTHTPDNNLAFSAQFHATCRKVRYRIDQLHELQDALAENLSTREADIRHILNEENEIANHRLPVVCFDGGGVRSYSSLVIFKALMDEVRWVARASEEDAIARSIRPCDVFTYMFGASSGGLIAIMLGRLKMTEEQCMMAFRTYTESMFGHQRLSIHTVSVFGVSISRYREKELVRATETLLRSFDPTLESQEWKRNRFAASAERCRCGVLAHTKPDDTVTKELPFILRSYDNTSSGARYRGKADNYLTWQVALATTVPKFVGKQYLDGGFYANSASEEASKELKTLHPNHPICLVSIGLGKHKPIGKVPPHGSGRNDYLIKVRLSNALNNEESHNRMCNSAAYSDSFSYFRFDVPGLEDVLLDEWTVKTREQWPRVGKMHTIDFIERQTNEYLAQDETRMEIRACAQMVVDSYCSSRGSVLRDR